MRTVVFGAGYWGINYIRELGGHLAAVVDPNESTSGFVAQSYQVPVYTDISKVWEIPFDYAVLATPPDTHVPLALELLKRGKKVLIEKPVAHSSAEVELLLPYQEQCMCGFIYLYHPTIIQLRNVLAREEINHVFMRRTNNGPVRTWGTAAWDLAVHDVATSMYWFGSVGDVRSITTRDWSIVNLTHATASSILYSSWCGGPKVRQIEVVLSDASERLVFDDMREVLTITPLRHMLTTFLQGDWDHRGSVEFALAVTRVMEQI